MTPLQRKRGFWIRNILRIALFMTFAFACSALSLAQEFSADVISHEAGGKISKSKLYRAATKERFDSTVERAGRTFGTYMIVDLRDKLIYLVEPEKKRILVNHILQMTGKTSGNSRPSANPCEEWMQAINPMGIAQPFKCTLIGSEPIGGRHTDKWEIAESSFARKGATYLWVDSQIKVVIKWILPGGDGGELQNIKVGPQPVSLFELPTDYGRQHLGMGK